MGRWDGKAAKTVVDLGKKEQRGKIGSREKRRLRRLKKKTNIGLTDMVREIRSKDRD